MKLLKIILAILLCALQTLIPHKPIQPPVDPPTVTTTVPQTEPSTAPTTEPSTESTTDPLTVTTTMPTTEQPTTPMTEPSTEPITEPPTEPLADPFLDRFVLTWSDEFDGDALDRTKWNGLEFTGGASPRRNGYWHMDMARVSGGALRIPSIYYESGYGGGPPGYYSIGICTSDSFLQTFGYFEVRCQLPKGDGLCSAFFLQSPGMRLVDGSGRDGMEIDIFEAPYHFTANKNRVSSALHYDGYGDAHRSQSVGIFPVEAPYDNFHTYALEWNTDVFIFYIDRVEVKRSTFGGVSQAPEFLILSVTNWFDSAWAGDIRNNNPEDMTDFVVDYVRVYQYK